MHKRLEVQFGCFYGLVVFVFFFHVLRLDEGTQLTQLENLCLVDSARAEVIVQRLTHGFKIVVHAAVTLKPLAPKIGLVGAYSTAITYAAPSKGNKVSSGARRLGDFSNLFSDHGQDQTSPSRRVALV